MIYRNLGAGLVDVPQPDTSELMKGALPDVTKLKASAWGLPELDDIKAPELEYEKNLDISATDALNEYYSKGQGLMNTALKLRNVGIDVANPDPFVEGSVEAAQLWNQEHADWEKSGVLLQQSLAARKEALSKGASPNVLMHTPPQNEIITDPNKYILPLDEGPIQTTANSFKNYYNAYGKENLDSAINEYLNAEEQIINYYDDLAKQRPDFKEDLEIRKLNTIARMKKPTEDSKFLENLDIRKKRLALDKQKFQFQQYAWAKDFKQKTENVEAGVEQSIIDMKNGVKSVRYLEGTPLSDFVWNPSKQQYERKFLKEYLPDKTYKDKSGREFMVFSTYEPDGTIGTFQTEYKNANGEINIGQMRIIRDGVKEAIGTKTPYGFEQYGELPVGTKITQTSGSSSGQSSTEKKPTPRNAM